MKVFVTGASGQLGHDVIRELRKRGHTDLGAGIAMDITDADMVRSVLMRLRPDAVIHCAAWTAVDAAEDADKADRVWSVNADGTQNVAAACKDINCKMAYISTDYVFSGRGDQPWAPDSKDFQPLNVYGKTKLAGELAVARMLEKFFIIRTAWVFGSHGRNFVETMLELGKYQSAIRVVCDQIGTPTYTADLARLLVDMIETERYGFYHATNEGGYISWYEFACEIFRRAGYPVMVIPVTTEDYGLSKAQRPKNSRLDKSKLAGSGFVPLPVWQDALCRYLKERES